MEPSHDQGDQLGQWLQVEREGQPIGVSKETYEHAPGHLQKALEAREDQPRVDLPGGVHVVRGEAGMYRTVRDGATVTMMLTARVSKKRKYGEEEESGKE